MNPPNPSREISSKLFSLSKYFILISKGKELEIHPDTINSKLSCKEVPF